jgi:hypothetical protein
MGLLSGNLVQRTKLFARLRGVPVWYQDGMICTGETYKSVVKLTFANGASLEDPSELFNSSLKGSVTRSMSGL